MKRISRLSSLVVVLIFLTVQPAFPESQKKPDPAKPRMPAASVRMFAPASPGRVIGNTDTRRYHLPGMPYYNKVKAYHRIYFESEQAAIDQGYYKAGTKKDSALSRRPPDINPKNQTIVTAAPVVVPPAAAAVPEQQTVNLAPEEKKTPPAPNAGSLQTLGIPPVTKPGQALKGERLLSLEDCLKIAFEQNRLRAVSGESVKIAETQYQQALSGHWPQLTLSVTGMRMDEEPTFVFPSQPLSLGATTGQYLAEAIAVAQLAKLGMAPGTPGYDVALAAATQQAVQELAGAAMPAYKVKLMDRDLLTSTLSLILPIYTGGKVSALARQAKAFVEASNVEVQQTDLQIIRDVKKYYYGHVFAQKLYALGSETLERFEATEALTQSVYQYGSGKVRKTDYLRSKMMTSAVRSVVDLLQSNVELSRSALANVMGLSWNTPVAVAETEIPFIPYAGRLDDLVALARRHNPQMNQMRLGLIAREEKIAEARSGHLPVVALFGNFTRLENAYDGGLITDENRNTWRIGISLELPVFNGLRTTREVQEARLRLQKLRHESLLLEEGVALQVKNAFLQIARSQSQVASLKEALATAAENRDLNIRAYAQEMVETKDVIEAQLMEFIMHSQYLKALYDHRVNQDTLEYIVGNRLNESR